MESIERRRILRSLAAAACLAAASCTTARGKNALGIADLASFTA